MSKRNFHSKETYCAISDTEILEIYLKTIAKEPKPDLISDSLYRTCIAISILEQTGNNFPSQIEIDYIESYVKRQSRKTALKKIA